MKTHNLFILFAVFGMIAWMAFVYVGGAEKVNNMKNKMIENHSFNTQ